MYTGRSKNDFFNAYFGGPTNLEALGKCPNCPCGNKAHINKIYMRLIHNVLSGYKFYLFLHPRDPNL